jgi:hypothetical protein
MSLYRFARASAMLALAGRYRLKLFKLFIAVAVALVTSWLFGDIAAYLDSHRPEWLGPALIIKTGVVYGALVYAFWQLRPAAWSEPQADKLAPASAELPVPETGPLDELLDKPRLRSRREAILEQPDKKKTAKNDQSS